MTVFVPLTRGFQAIIDDSDADRVLQFKWQSLRQPRNVYAVRRAAGVSIRLHRFILDAPSHLQVDHINRDSLDNRRANLRLCTSQQNSQNSTRPPGQYGYRGIYKCGSGYRAVISLNCRLTHSRHYETPAEAALEYDRLAREQHGEFAVLNFPEERAA